MIRNAAERVSVLAGSASYLCASPTFGAEEDTPTLAGVFPNGCTRLQTLFEAGKQT
jgi:hypothetical protein